MVRDFTYNEKDIADGKMEISKLEDDKKKQYVSRQQMEIICWSMAFYMDS